MTKAEELLNSLDETDESLYPEAVEEEPAEPVRLAALYASTATETDEPHVVIFDDRSMYVPDSIKKIGVQFDHDVNLIRFDCPRYSDGVDLYPMQFYVNYIRPDGTPGAYHVEDVTIDKNDSTILHFSWHVLRHATEYQGNLTILICVKETDDSGNLEHHWNTELNSDFYLSEGLVCDDVILAEYQDIITQLLTEMDVVKAIATPEAMQGYANAWLNQYGAETVRSVEQKGQEVLASIPEDYTQLSNDVNELKGDLDDLLNDKVIEHRHYGLVDLQLETGLLTDSGTWNTDTNYKHTQLIPVSNGDTIYVGHTLDGIETILCAYNNGVFVKTIKKSEMTLAKNFYSLTFESIDFTHVRASFYIGTNRQIVYFDNPTKYVDLENTNIKISKDNIISVNQDSIDGVYKQGLVFTPTEKINGFIGNNGNYVIDNNYSHSPLIKCKNGDTIYCPFFINGLNTFFAILYKDNKFVGVLDGTNSKIGSFIGDLTYYVHKIDTEIDFDSIVLNMSSSPSNAYINYVSDNSFYINTKTPNVCSRWCNKNIYVIGDSLTAAGVWYTVLEQRFNANVTARGMSGRGIQQFIDGATDVEGNVFPALTSDDLKDQDLIIVFGGYNNRIYPFGQVGDTPNGGTIAGLVGYVIESINNLLIQGNNNHCSLVWVTPHAVGSYPSISEDAYTEYPTGSGHNLLDQAEIMERQSNYYSVPCLNLCKNGGINKYNWDVYSANENDKVHLNYDGYIHIGNIISDFINSI